MSIAQNLIAVQSRGCSEPDGAGSGTVLCKKGADHDSHRSTDAHTPVQMQQPDSLPPLSQQV